MESTSLVVFRLSELGSVPGACSVYTKGSFFNYVDKTREVGGTGNVNGMPIFPYDSKAIHS